MMVALEGGDAPKPLLADPKFTETNGALSPDGRWIAYEANESGTRTDVFVRPFPDVNSGHWQVSSEGGNWPVWSRSGRELFFATSGPFRMMRVEVQPGAPFSHGKPQPVWDMTPYQPSAGRNWDIAKDGRFLMVKPSTTGKPSVTVVTHWFEELRAKVK